MVNNMNAKELANILDGRQYGEEITGLERRQAKENGLVVIHGASDDLMEVCGAWNDEKDCFGGGKFTVSRNGFVNPRCDDCKGCELFQAANKDAKTIRALWAKGGASWSYETEIPHETFRIFEDEELYCVGIIFSVDDV